MFYINYLKMCNSVNKTPSAVALDIGLEKSSVTRWKKGATPTDATVQRVAEYFGVTTDYLLDTEKEKTPATISDDGLTDKERELISILKQLPEEALDSIENLAKVLLNNQ